MSGQTERLVVKRTFMSAAIASAWLIVLPGCTQTSWRSDASAAPQTFGTPDQTMDLESTDRVNRLGRLAGMDNLVQPKITQTVMSAPDADRPVPVIRVVFDESDFFAPDGDQPRPSADKILQVVAEDMRRDVPDVRLTVLGHTDASGSASDNFALSERRALGVLKILVADGVNPGQLSTVAIGQSQPIAPNDTATGRARNRRVEFIISPSEQANLESVSVQPVNPDFLHTASAQHATFAPTQRVAVLKPSYAGPADVSEAPEGDGKAAALTLVVAGPPLNIGQTVAGASTANSDDATGSPVMGAQARRTGPDTVPPTTETGSPVGAPGLATYQSP